MKMTKDECMECGGSSTLRYPGGTIIKCLDCECETAVVRTTRRKSSAPPAITVSRYLKPDGYPTRYFAIQLDGNLLAVTVYRKGAEAVRKMLMEMLYGQQMTPALAANTNPKPALP